VSCVSRELYQGYVIIIIKSPFTKNIIKISLLADHVRLSKLDRFISSVSRSYSSFSIAVDRIILESISKDCYEIALLLVHILN